MPKRLRPQLTFANVVSCLALFVALGGSAYAVKQLPKKSVGTPQLKRGAVTKQKVRRNAIDGRRVRNNSLTGADIKLSKLGTVPSAGSANTANAANVANTASVANSLTPPEGWHEVGAPGQPLFENGFKNVGGEFSTVAFFKDHEGIVHLKGALSVGTPSQAAFTLPPGYRPSQKTFGPAAHTNTNDANIQVNTSGGVEIHSGGSSTAGLDGFDFRAES